MIFNAKAKRWWQDRFVTLMVIPERTRRVHKLVVPFFLLKMGLLVVSLTSVFFIIMGIDYAHVLGRISENKRLKGENFKLRQEMQLIRNKVDTMEATLERVTSYAKKLQLLTGQGAKGGDAPLPLGPVDEEGGDRELSSSKRDRRSNLDDRVENLQRVSLVAETNLSELQVHLLARSAILSATPSLLPITGWVSSSFGYRRHPYDGRYRLHTGIDIAAEPGTPVRAPANGQVIFSGFKEGYGKVIVIDHGYGIRTLFAHNSKLFVTTGMRLKRGAILSEVGSTGVSTGPHLHYEVRKNGVPVNPATFFSRSRF